MKRTRLKRKGSKSRKERMRKLTVWQGEKPERITPAQITREAKELVANENPEEIERMWKFEGGLPDVPASIEYAVLSEAIEMLEKIDKHYARELTPEQVDEFSNVKDFEDLTKALVYLKRHGGQLYTQVDADGDRAYLRGRHVVNRTGRWIVIKMTKKEMSGESE